MPGRTSILTTGEIYHIYNRGSDKRDIFLQSRDFSRFQQTFFYYQFASPKPRFSNFTKSKISSFKPLSDEKWIEIICFCLMPNHFHFMLKQLKDGGISKFISQLSNSYTKYFNTKYKRVGALLQGVFKSVRIETDEQLIHTSRYIHLNPIVSGITRRLEKYPWSSYMEYITNTPVLSSPKIVLDLFLSSQSYKKFVEDQIDYGKQLEIIKHQIIEEI